MKKALAIIVILLSVKIAEASIHGRSKIFPGTGSVQDSSSVEVLVVDRSGRTIAEGRGLVIDPDGLILTHCNMILKWYEDLQNDLIVRMDKDMTFPIYRLIAYNPRLDVAIFKIDTTGFPRRSKISQGAEAGFKTTRIRDEKIASYVRRVIRVYKDMIGSSKVLPPDEKMETEKARDSIDRPLPDRTPLEVKGSPEGPESPLLTGLRYASLKRYRDAIDEYTKALRIEPHNPDVYINLGLAYYKIERYRDAIDAYKKALIYGDASKSIYNKLGTLYLITGEYNEAISHFKRALSLDDKDPVTHFNLAIATYMKGDRDSAWEEYVVLSGLDEGFAKRLWDILN